MKGIRKWMAAGLAVVMAGVMLTGASAVFADEANTDVSGEVRYAYWDNNQTPYIEKCIEEFNKVYPNVTITLEPNTWDEYWTKLEASLCRSTT